MAIETQKFSLPVMTGWHPVWHVDPAPQEGNVNVWVVQGPTGVWEAILKPVTVNSTKQTNNSVGPIDYNEIDLVNAFGG